MVEYDIDRKMLGFVFSMAMQDAVRQRAYEGKRAWLWEESVFNKLYDRLLDHLDSVFGKEYTCQDEYDHKFIDLSIYICNEIEKKRNESHNDCNEFKFGNAQKLINMTVKYFYITSFGPDQEIKEYFKYCHCPMDGQMLENVWKKRKSVITAKGFSHDTFINGWSKMDEKQYKKEADNNEYKFEQNGRYHLFQTLLKDIIEKEDIRDKEGTLIIPIEYDFIFWGQNK